MHSDDKTLSSVKATMGGAIGSPIVPADSFDYSSHYDRRHQGNASRGGYSSSGYETETNNTYGNSQYGGGSTQYTGGPNSDYPSSGESDRKDRYHTYRENDDADSFTAMTDMGHHGSGRAPRRRKDDVSTSEADDSEETEDASSEGEEREDTVLVDSYDEETREGADYDDDNRNLRRVVSEPVTPYESKKRHQKHEKKHTKGEYSPERRRYSPRKDDRRHSPRGHRRSESPKKKKQGSPPRHRERSERDAKYEGKKRRSSKEKFPHKYKGIDRIELQQVEEEAYEMYADLQTQGTSSPRSIEALPSPPMTPTSTTMLVDSPKQASPTAKTELAVESEGFEVSKTYSDVTPIPVDLEEQQRLLSSFSANHTVNTNVLEEQREKVQATSPHLLRSDDCGEESPGDNDGVVGIEVDDDDDDDDGASEADSTDDDTNENERLTNMKDVVIEPTESRQSLEVISLSRTSRKSGQSVEVNPMRSVQNSFAGKTDQDIHEMPSINQEAPNLSAPESDSHSQYASLLRTKAIAMALDLDKELSPATSNGLRQQMEKESNESKEDIIIDRPSSPVNEKYRESWRNRFQKKEIVAPTPELGPRVFHSGPMFQSQFLYIQNGVSRDSPERRPSRSRSIEQNDTEREHRSLSPAPTLSQTASLVERGSLKENVHSLIKVGTENKSVVSKDNIIDPHVAYGSQCDQSVEASKCPMPEDKLVQSILNARIKQALAQGAPADSYENESHRGISKTGSLLSLTSHTAAHTASPDDTGDVMSEMGDVDLYFVQQYEIAFDVFMQQNIVLMARNPELVYNLRVAKLQQMLQVTAETEISLKSLIETKFTEKQDMLATYKKQLVEAARRKAALEIHLRHQLSIIHQATVAMQGKITWQTIAKNDQRAKRHYELLQKLSRDKAAPTTLLFRLPESSSSPELRDAVTAKASAEFTVKQERELQQLQVDTAFLKAEVKVLEKKLAAEQVRLSQYRPLNRTFRRR